MLTETEKTLEWASQYSWKHFQWSERWAFTAPYSFFFYSITGQNWIIQLCTHIVKFSWFMYTCILVLLQRKDHRSPYEYPCSTEGLEQLTSKEARVTLFEECWFALTRTEEEQGVTNGGRDLNTESQVTKRSLTKKTNPIQEKLDKNSIWSVWQWCTAQQSVS